MCDIPTSVETLAQLQKALKLIDARTDVSSATILLTESIALPNNTQVTLKSTKDITLTVDRDIRHIRLSSGQNLILGEGITLTRAAGYTGNGGGVNVTSATLSLHGGRITGVAVSGSGGAMNLNGSNSRFYMESGELSHNRAGSGSNGGGAIRLSSSGRVYIRGGEIFNNTGGRGGAIYASNTANEVNISGGKIYNNTGSQGGAVSCYGTFVMSGGELSGNHAGSRGGAVYMTHSGANALNKVRITGGVFKDNTAGNGAYSLDESDADLMIAYRNRVSVPDRNWSFGLLHGYNNLDIGSTQFNGHLPLTNVTFALNGATTGPAYLQRFPDGSGTVGASNMPADPTRDYYTFLGWYFNQTGPLEDANKFDGNTVIESGMTVFARWNDPPEVHFYNGSELVHTAIITAGVSRSLAQSGQSLPVPAPIFGQKEVISWNTQADGSGDAFDINTSVSDDMTVYAQWGLYSVITAIEALKDGERTVSITYDDGSAEIRRIRAEDYSSYDISFSSPSGTTYRASSGGSSSASRSSGSNVEYTVTISDSEDSNYGVRVHAYTEEDEAEEEESLTIANSGTPRVGPRIGTAIQQPEESNASSSINPVLYSFLAIPLCVLGAVVFKKFRMKEGEAEVEISE